MADKVRRRYALGTLRRQHDLGSPRLEEKGQFLPAAPTRYRALAAGDCHIDGVLPPHPIEPDPSVLGSSKTEIIYRHGPWYSFGTLECAALERVNWFEERRLLLPVGTLSPAEAEVADYPQLESEPIAA